MRMEDWKSNLEMGIYRFKAAIKRAKRLNLLVCLFQLLNLIPFAFNAVNLFSWISSASR